MGFLYRNLGIKVVLCVDGFMSSLKKLEGTLIRFGFWREAFDVGTLGLGGKDLLAGDASWVEEAWKSSLKSEEIFRKCIGVYLEGLDNLEALVDLGFWKEASDRSEEGVQILGPKTPEEMVVILEDLKWKEEKLHLWYDQFIDLVRDSLEVMEDSAAHRLFSGFLASTSVQTRPGHNFDLTMEYLHKFILSESRQNFSDYLKLMTPSGEASREERGLAKKKRLEESGLGESLLRPGETFLGHGIKEVDLNLGRLMKGEDPVGPKVNSFFRGLMRDYSASPTDRHVARILLGKDAPKSEGDFRQARLAMEEISRRMGLPILQVQSAIWCANLILTGKPVEDYSSIISSRREKLKELLSRAETIYLKG